MSLAFCSSLRLDQDIPEALLKKMKPKMVLTNHAVFKVELEVVGPVEVLVGPEEALVVLVEPAEVLEGLEVEEQVGLEVEEQVVLVELVPVELVLALAELVREHLDLDPDPERLDLDPDLDSPARCLVHPRKEPHILI